MIRTVLIDDEAPARDELRYLLTTNHSDVISIIGEADNATSSISLITKEKPDLIFLDIHMHGLSGLELGEVIRDISPKSKIIFATAYDEYALKAFELQALDYVVKPIEEERLSKAIQHAMKAIYPNGLPGNGQSMGGQTANGSMAGADGNGAVGASAAGGSGTSAMNGVTNQAGFGANGNGASASGTIGDGSAVTGTIAPQVLTNKLAVDDGAHILLIDIDTISYITGESGRLEVHTTNGTYTSNKTLTELQERLKGTSLYRVHRSYIVNLNQVREVVPWFKGTYWLRLPSRAKKDTELIDIPVSKAQVKPIKELLGIS
ncbi:MAG: LytTR family transcriptional regulator DNA-binding domain-containing protein [Veillonella sp.]|uniref:LytR/AlgR family response regulator transcription factor n=1 Tax=Veillonella sp. TaxID=1926307 RepID=UPI0025EDFB1C|nr:LytTR family transcriptional regulator DNA-binding domain-containing protein [Veillonella sp.]MBS4914253.1 LytTR family transcriptional regulator DNA-binding domain-containing protein [Veillonella sp.]